jgi:hypothetical protein
MLLEVVVVRGVILDPKGQLETTFTWDIGKSTNNQAEAYALL